MILEPVWTTLAHGVVVRETIRHAATRRLPGRLAAPRGEPLGVDPQPSSADAAERSGERFLGCRLPFCAWVMRAFCSRPRRSAELGACARRAHPRTCFDTMAAHGVGLASRRRSASVQVVIFGFESAARTLPDAAPVPRTILLNPVIGFLSRKSARRTGAACRYPACAAWCRAPPHPLHRLHARGRRSERFAEGLPMRAWCSTVRPPRRRAVSDAGAGFPPLSGLRTCCFRAAGIARRPGFIPRTVWQPDAAILMIVSITSEGRPSEAEKTCPRLQGRRARIAGCRWRMRRTRPSCSRMSSSSTAGQPKRGPLASRLMLVVGELPSRPSSAAPIAPPRTPT